MTLDNTTLSDNQLPTIVLAMETSTAACSVALKVGDTVQQLYEEGNNLHSLRLLQMVDELLQQNQLSLQDVQLLAVGIGPGAFTGLRIGVGVAQGLAYSHSIPVIGVSSLQALSRSVLLEGAVSESIISENGISESSARYVVTGLDARMSELYWAVFKVSSPALGAAPALGSSASSHSGVLAHSELLGELCLSAPQNIELPDLKNLPISFVGNAWTVYADDFSKSVRTVITQAGDNREKIVQYPQARWVLEQALVDFTAELQAEFSTGAMIDCHELAPLYIRDDVAKKSTKNPLG